ncbi:MSN4 [[Candida] subhashii]|uniref:pH-response transcription factor pacC/RIM101 n=1 Tax=[Candida] subhashii TaxID=561895 RepID=A0A8J5QGZ0_9ASCO|nr:MSN4 [[Candida] subhashii]KAG7664491.1 MSN4 [[Candida] subhashii]
MTSDYQPLFENTATITSTPPTTNNNSNYYNTPVNSGFSFDTQYTESLFDNQQQQQQLHQQQQSIQQLQPAPAAPPPQQQLQQQQQQQQQPESIQLNDEIFFTLLDQNQSQQQQLQQQLQQSIGQSIDYSQVQMQPQQQPQSSMKVDTSTSSKTLSNMSSSNSLSNYFTTPNTSASSSSSSSFSSSSSNINVTTPKVSSTPYFARQARQNSTSIPIDQLTLLSLRTPSTSSNSTSIQPQAQQQQQQQQQQAVALQSISQPNFEDAVASPDLVDVVNSLDPNSVAAAAAAAEATIAAMSPLQYEEPTINPKQLFTDNKLNTSISSPSLSTLFMNTNYQLPTQLPPSNSNNAGSTLVSPLQSSPPQFQPQQQSQQLVSPQMTQFPQNTLPPQKFLPQHSRSISTPHFDFGLISPDHDLSPLISNWMNNNPSSTTSTSTSEFVTSPRSSGFNTSSTATTPIISGTGTTKKHSRSYSVNVNHSQHAQQHHLPHHHHSMINLKGINRRNSAGAALQQAAVASQSVTQLQAYGLGIVMDENNNDNESSIGVNGVKNKRRKSQGNVLELGTSLQSGQISPTNTSNGGAEVQPDGKSSNGESAPTASTTTSNGKKSSTSSSSSSGSSGANSNSNGSFPCAECDKQFKRSEHLKRHIRSVHSNIRPFHCKYCEKKFSRSDNLAQHLKTHYRVDSEGNACVVLNPAGMKMKKGKKSAGGANATVNATTSGIIRSE